MDQLGELIWVKPKRSMVLTILCILSFLGGSYGIFSSIIAYRDAQKFLTEASAKMRQSEKEISTHPEGKFSHQILKDATVYYEAKKIKLNSLIAIIYNLATLMGAFLMFKMNRKGYWFYVAGILVAVVTPLLIFGYNSLAGLLAFIPGFVGLLFIALYAFQLKDMKLQPLYE